MRSFWKRALTFGLSALMVVSLSPFGNVGLSFADDPDPQDAPASDQPAHEGPHTYVDGVCTQCGEAVAWDVAYAGPESRGIYLYAIDKNGNITELDDKEIQKIGITASMYRTNDPSYRYDFGLNSLNTSISTLYETDYIIDRFAEYIDKYETLSCIISFNENHEPQVTNVEGGRAEFTLLSEYDPETGTYSNLSENGNPQFEERYYLYLADASVPPAEVETVNSRAAGFTINLYNYTAGGKGTMDENGSNGGINQVSDLQFFQDADPDTADSTMESNELSESAVAKQGIVESELGTDGYPALTEFDGNSLDVLFSADEIDGAKDVYADVNHLFQMSDDGYYVYSSDSNYAYYDESQGDGGNFVVYDGTYNQARQTDVALIDSGVPIGFFPMNAYDSLANDMDEATEEELTHNTGMSIETSFTLPASGKVDGEALTFEYTGDDDAWLYIDDVLVLDAGGIHSKLNATVDFSSGDVTVGNASALEAAKRTIGRGSTLAEIFKAAGKEWTTEGKHTLKFYSLERDGKQSDLTIKTNLYKVTDAALTDVVATKKWVDADGNETEPAADSVTVQLYQTVNGKTEPVPDATLELSADNDWTDSFKSLPMYDEDDNQITYSVKEDQVDGSFATYEVGGQTQKTNVYWVLYNASEGVEPGVYAILSMSGDADGNAQPVLLTSVGEDKEVTYTDTFFVNETVTDGKTGETYDQYIKPVTDPEIWTISKTEPQTFITREAAEGLLTDENGYTVLKTTPSTGYFYPGAVSPYTFYEKANHIYTKGDDGTYTEVEGEVYKYSGNAWRVSNDVSISPRTIQEYDENGYALYYTSDYVEGHGYGWVIYYVKDGKVYQKNGSSYTESDMSINSLSPLNAVAHEDGYVVLVSQNYMGAGKYYTTDQWDGVYRKNADGTYTKLQQYGDYVPTGFYANTSAEMEDGYYVMDGSDGNVYYLDPSHSQILLTKTADGTYVPFMQSQILYAVANYTESESAEYDFQISNQGMNLTLVGPGQQWMDYTYITSNVGTKQGNSNEGIVEDESTFGSFNYRDVFRLDPYTTAQMVYNPYGGTTAGGDTIAYGEPNTPSTEGYPGGLRIYSFQELWQFTGLVTGYEKNLSLGSSYETKENYVTAQSGHFWLYKPIYEEAPLDLTDTDWTIVNMPAGDVSVTKEIAGEPAASGDTFTFTMKLSGDEDLVNQVNGTFGDMEFVGGMATFTLTAGETKVAKNLPAGLSYTVEETLLPGYKQESASGNSGTVPERDTAAARFVNKVPLGNLTVSKSVKGDDDGTVFNFNVVLTDTSITGTYGDMTFEKGLAVVSLAAGQSVTAMGLPANTQYSVTELDTEGWGQVSAEGDKGTIAEDATATASFVNAKSDKPSPEPTPDEPKKPTIPSTGDSVNLALPAALAIMAAAALVIAFYLKRRQPR